jgi:hypothetical protein
MAARRFVCRTILTADGGTADLPHGRRTPSVPHMENACARMVRSVRNDGYVLRCDWSSFGIRKELKYSDIAP